MAQNPVPTLPARRTQQAQRQINGLNAHGVELQISRVPAAALQMSLDLYINNRDGAALSQTAQKNARAAYNATVTDAKKFAGKVRRHFQDVLGTQHNALWLEAGFAAGSTAVPGGVTDLLALFGKIKTFLTNHAEYQLAIKNITPTDVDFVAQSITNAQSTVSSAVTAHDSAKAVTRISFRNLGKKMGDSIAELKLALAPDDVRWYDFGLRRPSDPEAPNQPLNVVLSGAGIGRILVTWDDTPGAERYHVMLQKPGDVEAQLVATVQDSEKALNGLTSGQTVKVWIRALNDAGQSPLSAMQQIVVP